MKRSQPKRQAQLDKEEREKIEEVVVEMRERIESDIRYRLKNIYGLKSRDSVPEDLSSEEKRIRKKLVKAIEREATDGYSWEEAFRQYVKAVGYTIVNRLAAFRCMEVRGFLDREVSQFREDGVTPAADPIIKEEFADSQEGVIKAYKRACDRLADDIGILFDLSGPYSIINPQFDTFKDLCKMLDKIDENIWRADDVLGWVYEYYILPDLPKLRQKAREEGLDPEDTTIANQFYTPHWVVRMLTDNSLGKLYLEHKDDLLDTIKAQEEFSIEKRKNRSPSPSESPSLKDLCTYLVPTKEEGESTKFEDPSEIRVIDPACGSGHFLLYAFDILERIWWRERPDLDRAEIPNLILKYNLYGTDLDLRACQMTAFNLYLKARKRAEEEGAEHFELPKLGIVCSDAHIAEVEDVIGVFEEVAGDQPELKGTLKEILEQFEKIHGLGSLLDVKGTLSKKFIERKGTLKHFIGEKLDLSSFLEKLYKKIEEIEGNSSFRAQDLKSFLQLLVVLSQDYDVALMNPPYGHGGRMPKSISSYIETHYRYSPEYYINFFEVCYNLLKKNGRTGMIVPDSFMFKKTFEKFREDFVGKKGSFDFLAEYGLGVLDNSTVNTVGTIVRKDNSQKDSKGKFIRLHDVDSNEKEETYLRALLKNVSRDNTKRIYTPKLSQFKRISGTPISYWASQEIRSLYDSDCQVEDLAKVREGIATGNDDRFIHYFWETDNEGWPPFVKGGKDPWVLPRINMEIYWGKKGKELRRFEGGNGTPNEEYYFEELIAFNNIKTKDGRRFGFLPGGSIFSHVSYVIIPEIDLWCLISYLNSLLVTYLMLCQTTDRHWQTSEIAKIPWDNELGKISELGENARDIGGLLLSIRRHQFSSPYYTEPIFLHLLGVSDSLSLYSRHPHRKLLDNLNLQEPETAGKNTSFHELESAVREYWSSLRETIKKKSDEINHIIFNHFDIDGDQQEEILTEIGLRMGENPRKAELVPKPPSLPILVKKLLLHFTLEIVHGDGVVPLSNESDQEEPDLLSRIEEKFREVFWENSNERLAEADQILGDRRPSGDEAYPNIRYWLENGMFEFHLKEFENAPILWKLTTKRLVPDPIDEGFACFIDYHKLDPGIFDRISTSYLGSRKSALREKRNIANDRRHDQSLSASERSKAAEEYRRCENALKQIREFEGVTRELGRVEERDWGEEDRQLAAKLLPKIREFRRRIENRLKVLDKLVNVTGDEWFEDFFCPTFLERVEENREEWIDALHDLETACKQYKKDGSTPVEAHLYDLFTYFAELVGSTHYGSNGIFFLNYYFSKGKKFLEEEKPRRDLKEREKLLAKLAAQTDDDVELGKEIKVLCDKLKESIPSEWKKRALEEIMTSGYNPVKKHGVAINIQPLADAKIVPSIVENKVI